VDRNEIAIHIRVRELKANRVFDVRPPYPPQKVPIALMTGVGKKLSKVAEVRIAEYALPHPRKRSSFTKPITNLFN
jgi:hypothetical protein